MQMFMVVTILKPETFCTMQNVMQSLENGVGLTHSTPETYLVHGICRDEETANLLAQEVADRNLVEAQVRGLYSSGTHYFRAVRSPRKPEPQPRTKFRDEPDPYDGLCPADMEWVDANGVYTPPPPDLSSDRF